MCYVIKKIEICKFEKLSLHHKLNMEFKKTIDNIEIYYECYILGIYRERITNVYPSKKENAFVYMDDKTVMHNIPYKWYTRYDQVKGKAIFINSANIPLFITISKENLQKYCAPKLTIRS